MGSYFKTVWLVTRKDIRVETRSWEMVSTTLFFAASCVLVFSFAFVREGRPVDGAAAGIVWIAVAFSGTLALGRAFERERYQDAMRGLLMAPAERSAIFLGKLLGVVLLMVVVESIIVLLRSPSRSSAPLFALSPGISVVIAGERDPGRFRGGRDICSPRCCSGRESRGVLLPVLLYPMTFPVLMAGVGGTVALMQAEPNLDLARLWAAHY